MTSVPATTRTTDDLIRALPVIMGEMRRVPVLKNWDEATRKGLIRLQEPHRKLVGEACMDSSILAVRALDEFFRTRRATPKGSSHLKSARPGDLFAEEFGYIDDQPLLSRRRREDINQLMSHFTWRRIDENLSTDLRDDLVCVIPHSLRFLTWVVETGVLDGKPELAAEATALIANMRRVLADRSWGRQLSLTVPEEIMKATAVVVSGSDFATTFSQWNEGSERNGRIVGFRADHSELAALLNVLSALSANGGINASFEGCSLGKIVDWWSGLKTRIEHQITGINKRRTRMKTDAKRPKKILELDRGDATEVG